MKIPDYCTDITNNRIITLKDKGNSQKMTINNPNLLTIIKIRVDGCAITGDTQRCDYMLKIENHSNIQ